MLGIEVSVTESQLIRAYPGKKPYVLSNRVRKVPRTVYVESDDPDQYTIGLVRVLVTLAGLGWASLSVWALIQGNFLSFLQAKPIQVLYVFGFPFAGVMALVSIHGMGRRRLVICDGGDQLALSAANDLQCSMPLTQAMPKTVVSQAEIYPYSYRGWSGSVDVKQPGGPINAVWLRLGDPKLPRWVILEHAQATVDLQSAVHKWNDRLHSESMQEADLASQPPRKVILDQRKSLL